MAFTDIDSWGFVEPDTRVQDSKGTKYIVTDRKFDSA